MSLLDKFGIEDNLQLGVTACVVLLVAVPTLNILDGATGFLIHRTLLIVITILCMIGRRHSGLSLSRPYVALLGILAVLSLASIFQIPGSRFEALSIFYEYCFLASAFLTLSGYCRGKPVRWKEALMTIVLVLVVASLLPDLLRLRRPISGFSAGNPDYFGTFLLIGLAMAIAMAGFLHATRPRFAAAAAAALLFFGIAQTWSRGAVLAAVLIVVVAAVRAGNRIPRRMWIVAAFGMLLLVAISSPFLLRKFLDRGGNNPYNYARIQIWMASLRVIAEHPLLGTGPGQFIHVSKRFNFPVEGQVARYEKHIGIAHSEYLQQIAELGLPTGILLFSLLAVTFRLAWKRAKTAEPSQRIFFEAAILTGAGVGAHSAVDNCWTVPVMSSVLLVCALPDLLPRQPKARVAWTRLKMASAVAGIIAIYIPSTLIPGIGLYYDGLGIQAYRKGDLVAAERYHREAVDVIADASLLENLSKVYIAEFDRTKNPARLELAQACLRRAFAVAPRAVEPYLRMEDVLVRSFTGNEESDLALHRRIIENNIQLLSMDPYLPFPRKNLAIAYYNLGQQALALEEMRKALEYEPNYIPAYLQLASWYGDQGDTAAKGRYIATAMSIAAKYRDYKPEAGYEAILLGRPEESWK